MTRSLSRSQALLLGLVVMSSLAIGGWALLTLPQRNALGRDSITVTAAFRDVAGLQTGTRVHLQGVDVGEVVAVNLPDIAGEPVQVQLRLVGHLQTRLGADAQVKIARDNPLADRIVRLVPGLPDSPRLTDGAVLVGAEAPDLFDGLAQVAGKLNSVLTQLDKSLAQVDAGKGTLGKLLHDEKLYDELTGAVRELKAAAYDIRQGDGTVGQLVKNRAVYDKTLETVEEVRAMVVSVKQNADALKSLPLVRNYVVDVNKELVRPDSERLRKIYAEEELFEPGRAVLTEKGKTRLDATAEWLKGYKDGEVIVASLANPATNAAFAQTLTQKQSEVVRDYLLTSAVHRTGYWWWNTRPVRAVACGITPPAQPEAETLPAARIEVVLFLPTK